MSSSSAMERGSGGEEAQVAVSSEVWAVLSAAVADMTGNDSISSSKNATTSSSASVDSPAVDGGDNSGEEHMVQRIVHESQIPEVAEHGMEMLPVLAEEVEAQRIPHDAVAEGYPNAGWKEASRGGGAQLVLPAYGPRRQKAPCCPRVWTALAS